MPEPTPATPTATMDVELFAGAGGLAIGLKAAGFGPFHLYERDVSCCDTLDYNTTSEAPTLDGEVHKGSVEKVDWRSLKHSVRLLAAGAPCQPFSLAGKHQGQEDERNLFPQVIRAVRELQPQAVLIENVRGLLRGSLRPYFAYVLRQLAYPSVEPKSDDEPWDEHDKRLQQHDCAKNHEAEYVVDFSALEAADYGVPQQRWRVFVVSTRPAVGAYSFPQATHSKAALLHTLASDQYWERHEIAKRQNGPCEIELPLDDGCAPWVTVRDALRGLPEPAEAEKDAQMNHWAIPGARAYDGHIGSDLDWPSKTIKAGVHGVPGGENMVILDDGSIRYYTLREAARLQTFPDAHLFKGARSRITRQIGNAVPCRLGAVVAKPLYDLLNSEGSYPRGR